LDIITSFFAFTGIKKPFRFILGFWAKATFLILGKKLPIQGKEHLM